MTAVPFFERASFELAVVDSNAFSGIRRTHQA